jgi:hypothetical protein
MLLADAFVAVHWRAAVSGAREVPSSDDGYWRRDSAFSSQQMRMLPDTGRFIPKLS